MSEPTEDEKKLADAPEKKSVDKIRDAMQKEANRAEIRKTVDKAAQQRKDGK